MQDQASGEEADAEEPQSSIADLQAELLYVMDDLRDNNLAASRSSSNSIQEWKAFLETATDAEVFLSLRRGSVQFACMMRHKCIIGL